MNSTLVDFMVDHKIKHLAIIPDGNRRFAKAMMKESWIGHRYGVKKIKDVLDWCRELNIKYLTLYAFSIENFNRPKKEFDMIMKMFEKEFDQILKDKKHDAHKYKIRVNVIGRREMLPKKLQEKIGAVERLTSGYDGYFLNLAIAYGGRAEIVDACRKMASAGIAINNINEKDFESFLYTNGFPDPDLIIRTSEQRLSGFLLWQSAYSEFKHIPKSFPQLTKEDFMSAIKDFSDRDRRFGK